MHNLHFYKCHIWLCLPHSTQNIGCVSNRLIFYSPLNSSLRMCAPVFTLGISKSNTRKEALKQFQKHPKTDISATEIKYCSVSHKRSLLRLELWREGLKDRKGKLRALSLSWNDWALEDGRIQEVETVLAEPTTEFCFNTAQFLNKV